MQAEHGQLETVDYIRVVVWTLQAAHQIPVAAGALETAHWILVGDIILESVHWLLATVWALITPEKCTDSA